MTIHMTIRNKLLALSLGSVFFVAVVGATGLLASQQLKSASAQIETSAEALRNQMQADQAHDALRGDVLAALLAAEQKSATDEAPVREAVEAHSKLFRDSVAALEALKLDDGVRGALEKVRPSLLAYVSSANTVVGLAFKDRPAALENMKGFNVAFKNLEREMEALSDLIGERAKSVQASSDAVQSWATTILVATAVIAALVMLAIGTLVSRSIVRPIRRAVDIARTVATGDLSARIEVSGHDETAQLLGELKRMTENLAGLVLTVRQSSDSHRDRLGADRHRQRRPVASAPRSRPATCSRPRPRWSS